MSIPDETLMAFADGELDAVARAEVEAALREDPELAQRVARHVALRRRVQMAYSSELVEPVPQRLLEAANRAPSRQASVVNLQDARDAKRRDAASPPQPVGWRPAAAIAASLLVGFGVGYVNRHPAAAPVVQGVDGALTADGALNQALSTQLAARQDPASAVRIGVSFLAKNGEYCRTFNLRGAVSPSGLACRHAEQWRIETLSQSSDPAGGAFRPAGTSLAPDTLKAVEERIDGDTLDAAGEATALQKGWRK